MTIERKRFFGKIFKHRTASFERNLPDSIDQAQFTLLCQELLAKILDKDHILRLASPYVLLNALGEALTLHGFTEINAIHCEIQIVETKTQVLKADKSSCHFVM